ncbi:S8 family serine peptidase [Micromonospora profundi]|uniref:S8 family serine peptidase n=1 Tax=Micromonospora profundi TaxID=1420889 RepID=UPI002FF3D248
MLAKHPILARLLVVVMTGCVLLAVPRLSAANPTPDNRPYVKYYVVAAQFQGQPENLTDIAWRLLGSGERSDEIYHLNTGRVQPDGLRLTDPGVLTAGWYLVLPWDAAGEGVKYGQLPPAPAPTRTARPGGTTKPGGTPKPSGSPSPTASPTRGSPGPGATGGTQKCTAAAGSSSRSDWAQLRMAADSAWTLTRGNGVKIAVVDTGVDASLQQLSGRVAVGADVTVGNGRGDTDCVGSGTAMAGIIAADSSVDGSPVGIAPDATILPVRMVGSGAARAADAATAIEVAVSAGASVVALGSHVDLAAPAVAASLTTALNHDVLVVAGAPTKPAPLPSPGNGAAGGALLLTGGVGPADQFADEYLEGTVEVVAPGVDVASLGTGGRVTGRTGTGLAVAFVAGQAALIRAAEPDLTAAQVKERILGTADPLGGQDPHPAFGAGMINLATSVAGALDNKGPVSTGQERRGSGAAIIVLLGLALVCGVGVVFGLRMRRRRFAG